jgi:hypothetical protein
VRSWPRHYLCYRCAWQRRERRATIRIFTGADGHAAYSGGWPVCDAHKDHEITCALRSMFDDRNAMDWCVRVYVVDTDEDDWPTLGRVIFTARPKPLPFKDLHHAAAPS